MVADGGSSAWYASVLLVSSHHKNDVKLLAALSHPESFDSISGKTDLTLVLEEESLQQ